MPDYIPAACVSIQTNIDNLNSEISSLQYLLNEDDLSLLLRKNITNKISGLKIQLTTTEQQLDTCIINNTPPDPNTPKPTMPDISPDTSPVPRTKTISIPFLNNKFDEFINKRTDPPIFMLRLHNHDHLNSDGSVDNGSPDSDFTFYFIDALTLLGLRAGIPPPKDRRYYQGYKSIINSGPDQLPYVDLGRLPDEYYFNDINSSSFNVNIDTSQPTPLEVKITFETDGPKEMSSKGLLDPLIPDMDFTEFYISIRFTLGFDAQNHKVDLLNWVNDLQNMSISIANERTHIKGSYLGNAIDQTIDSDDFDTFYDEHFIQPIVHVHIAPDSTLEGIAQKSMRKRIFDNLMPTEDSNKVRGQINAEAAKWLLGEDGKFPVINFENNGEEITISYSVPQNMLNPFPVIPDNWPSANNPSSNPNLDFSPGALANIDHIVVLTKENRSFDHILGYLSLPANKGGMDRKEVDGLTGAESNPYKDVNYPSFPFGPDQTLFAPNASQDAGASYRQVDGGKMDGFVKSYAVDASNISEGEYTGDGSTIMGYHTGTNVPVYDALARDFAICQRWFAAHPGPTFPNRFYELTGRLNLASGLNTELDPGYWEIDNTSPLTPVLTKTIFDHLTDYSKTIANVSWNYFEYAYCTLRFFAEYTFDNTNIVSADDPINGFFVKARTGTLPSVSFIDPHFIDLPPNGNCDEPPSDIKDGQDFVQRVVEAVITSPNWNKTLLIIIYDEHGGFYDHVYPPMLQPFQDDRWNFNFPVKTYGLRVPAFFISPWVSAGQVFGHVGGTGSDAPFFDHTSILKTIAKRFMSDRPPYMGPHYAVANDLSVIIGDTMRQPQFLPFIRYNLMYNFSQKMLDVQWGYTSPGTPLWEYDKNGSFAQDFSFEDAGNGFVYIRTHAGRLYVTVAVQPLVDGAVALAALSDLNIIQDVKYKEHLHPTAVNPYNPAYQKWKLSPAGITILQRELYVISNAYFGNKVLKAIGNESGGAVVLGDPDPITHSLISPNAWNVSSPLINDQIVNR